MGKLWRLSLDPDEGTGEVLGLVHDDDPVVSLPPKAPCINCPEGGMLVIRWLLLRWYGTPAPIRWWKERMSYCTQDDMRGCGCLVKAKALTQAVRLLWFA